MIADDQCVGANLVFAHAEINAVHRGRSRASWAITRIVGDHEDRPYDSDGHHWIDRIGKAAFKEETYV